MNLEDKWFGMEGNDEDSPFIIRGRDNLIEFKESRLYNNRVDILWEYNSNDNTGMPEENDLELMEQVENSLVSKLESDIQSVLAFVFTGKNQRVWYWYTKDINEAANRINAALEGFPKLPVQLFSSFDPDWNEYNDILD